MIIVLHSNNPLVFVMETVSVYSEVGSEFLYNKHRIRINNNNYYYYLLQLGCHPVAVVILHVNKI